MLPILLYGFLLFGQKFPVQERVEAGVSYRDMLAELGWGGDYIVSFLLIMGISQILTVLNGTTIGGTTLHLEPIKILIRITRGLSSRNCVRPIRSLGWTDRCSFSCCS